jgi:NADH-quinone oxidoreductase subunit M
MGTFIATADASQWPGVLGPEYAAIAAIGMVLAAMYLLIMVGKVVFGKLKEPNQDGALSSLPTDLSPREIGILVPLAALCIWIGVQPTVLTDAMRGSVEEVLAPYPRLVQQEQEAPSTPIVLEKEDPHG